MTPDTEVKCVACKRTKINPRAHPSHRAQCGACFGSGLSTAPWDQRRNATTVTIWDGEDRKFPAGTEFYGPGKAVSRRIGQRVQQGLIYLISWPNPNYPVHPVDCQKERT